MWITYEKNKPGIYLDDILTMILIINDVDDQFKSKINYTLLLMNNMISQFVFEDRQR